MTVPNFKLERRLWSQGYRFVVGIDEVGRGALAGPVVAGAVIFSPGSIGLMRRNGGLKDLRDSKLLTPLQREKLDPLIKTNCLSWAVGWSSPKKIDQNGIVSATGRAMRMAIGKLKVQPDFHLIDYFRLNQLSASCQQGVIDGDTLVVSIAAASVIAKVYRDALMVGFHKAYSGYGFDRHKGYGTAAHLDALRRCGPCPLHRLSFIDDIF